MNPQMALDAAIVADVAEGLPRWEEHTERIVQAVAGGLVAWNLVDAEGQRRPLAAVVDLDYLTLVPVLAWFEEVLLQDESP